jgi:hypothetical protein
LSQISLTCSRWNKRKEGGEREQEERKKRRKKHKEKIMKDRMRKSEKVI